MGIMQLLNIGLFWLFFGLITSHFAKKRGRNSFGWFLIGLFLGLLGMLLVLLLPKVERKPRPIYKPPPQRSEAWMKMWYYLDPSYQQQGPFEFPDFIKKYQEKGITDKSYIWGEGMQEWKPLEEFPDLVKEMETAS